MYLLVGLLYKNDIESSIPSNNCIMVMNNKMCVKNMTGSVGSAVNLNIEVTQVSEGTQNINSQVRGKTVCNKVVTPTSQRFTPGDRDELIIALKGVCGTYAKCGLPRNSSLTTRIRDIVNRSRLCPISQWDVSNVHDMSYLFDGLCFFNEDIGNWDVSHVTNMEGMFRGLRYFDQPLDKWNVSSVVNMAFMFSGARRFNQNIGNWNVSSVEKMNAMFFGAERFNQPLDWNTSKVTDMNKMFQNAYVFNQPLDWDTSNVVDMKCMFKSAYTFNKDIGLWNVSNVTNMYEMFYGASAFDQSLSRWNVSNVSNMEYMFEYAYAMLDNINYQLPSDGNIEPSTWNNFFKQETK